MNGRQLARGLGWFSIGLGLEVTLRTHLLSVGNRNCGLGIALRWELQAKRDPSRDLRLLFNECNCLGRILGQIQSVVGLTLLNP